MAGDTGVRQSVALRTRWSPSCCSVLLGGKAGTVGAGTEPGPSGGGMRMESPPHSPSPVPAVLTGRGELGRHLGLAACCCLHLAVDGGGVLLLLGAKK